MRFRASGQNHRAPPDSTSPQFVQVCSAFVTVLPVLHFGHITQTPIFLVPIFFFLALLFITLLTGGYSEPRLLTMLPVNYGL